MSEFESRLTRASAPTESHATQSESKADTACDSLLGTVKSTFDPFKETFSSEGGTLHHVSEAVNSLASLQGMPSQLLNTGIAQIPLLDKMPGMPAATIGVPHLGTPHAHSHPPSSGFPLPSVGATIGSGCLSVLIGGIPAARVLDIGIAPTCGGITPFFDIQTGSSNTFIGGMRAARMGIDMTRHCNPMGHVGHSGGEAASAAEKGEEVASEAAQVSGRAKALGRAGKAWSVGNAAVGPASGVATAADDASQGEVAAAAMMAAQTAADLAFMALSNLMGKDPGIEPSMGTLLAGDPTVLIGGFPLPDSQMMWHGAKHGIGKKVGPKLPKPLQELKCEFRGEPINPVTGDVRNDFIDYETAEVVPFRWGRHYSSGRHDQNSAIGYGFRHFWQHELILLRKTAIYVDPQGARYRFNKQADGTYGGCCQGNILEQTDSLRFVIHQEAAGYIEFERTEDTERIARCIGHFRDGATNVLTWNNKWQLARITQSDDTEQVRRIISISYNEAGEIVEISMTNADGTIGNIARYEYDERSCLIRHHNAIGYLTRYEYDSQRRVVRLADATGYSFSYRYDIKSRCLESSGQDGMWHVQFQYQPGRTIITEGDGGRWTIHHNDAGTITRVTDPYGGATEYVLDDAGNISREIAPSGQVLRWLYNERMTNTGRLDHWGNIWPTKDEMPNLPNPFRHIAPDTPLDWMWGSLDENELSESVLLPATQNQASEATSPEIPKQLAGPQRLCDPSGRQIEAIDAFGNSETFEWDAAGNLLHWRDKDGSLYRHTYASWNLRRTNTDPLGSTERFTYTSRREVASIADATGNEIQYKYDLKNRITQTIQYGALHETYKYDSRDLLTEKHDSLGNLILRYEVNDIGLYKRRLLASGEIHKYRYDPAGNIIDASTEKHRIIRKFDKERRLISDKRDNEGVEHEYHNGRLSRTIYFGKFEIRYETISNGETSIYTPSGDVHRLHRGADGRVLVRFGNGTNVAYEFDTDNRCTRRQTWSETGVHTVDHVQYEYSATGELRRTVDAKKGTTAFTYDAAHRLLRETRDGWLIRSFEYDPAGNLLATPTHPWLRYTDGNRLAAAPSIKFTYNTRNHLSEEVTADHLQKTYHYNSLDLLTKVTWSDRTDVWTAEYDGFCRRIHKTHNDGRRDFYWDGDRLAAEKSPNGNLRIYVYASNSAYVPFIFLDYSSLEADPRDHTAYHVITNQIGIPEVVEDVNRRICWRADDIDPYGLISVSQESSISLNLRFPGHYFDEEVQLHDNRYRSYSPSLGRYLQFDPSGQAGGINLYAYTSNPLVNVDVFGLTHTGGAQSDGKSNHEDSEIGGSHQKAESKSNSIEHQPVREDVFTIEIDPNLSRQEAAKEMDNHLREAVRNVKNEYDRVAALENKSGLALERSQLSEENGRIKEKITALDSQIAALKDDLKTHKANGDYESLSKTGKEINSLMTQKKDLAKTQALNKARYEAIGTKLTDINQRSHVNRVYESSYDPRSGHLTIARSGQRTAEGLNLPPKIPDSTTEPGKCAMPKSAAHIMESRESGYAKTPEDEAIGKNEPIYVSNGGYGINSKGQYVYRSACENCGGIPEDPNSGIVANNGHLQIGGELPRDIPENSEIRSVSREVNGIELGKPNESQILKNLDNLY
ncbi:type IV secretion protein Rhs [Burkholderia lata]|uniref:HlyD family efflux transporter periplasmic adaptor subunit n=1 Tax=Burkholderia lata (strain ATCC 17760 / DSM 23089 / LMG 22485 / NCIMB 9086 / R18194 / 383) TaxID=482957 RepID=UPI001454B801|nr:RHS repeat-associated core domain-containing protein [Burkholderia lata]VWB88041.1 type IV secretion protein Rhs [Burkholderia lata]